MPGPPTLAEIGEAIRRHGVTTLWLTAGLFHLMVDEHLEGLKPLRQLLAGGEVLSPERVRKAFRALPGCRIINGYGPTENTTFTCCHVVADDRELTPGVPIGRPIANTRVYVLDSHLQPLPVGVAGELFAGGDGVACGYLHQPQLTAERFVPDPFSGKAGARLYRTGDLARWRPDGNLEFLGRLDSQVKIRGFRIELGEVEAALRAQSEVREAVVAIREDMPGDKRLVAYLVAKTGEKPDASILRMRLAKKLPDYMIPNAFAWLDQLPLTASGKMDRKALAGPEASAGNISNGSGQPVSLLELELARIWQRLFRRENIVRQDNFFELGGHSLMAARMAAEIDKRLGSKLPIAALFQSPTIESLARRLTDENWAPLWSSLVPLQPQGSKPPIFLVHGWGGDVFVFLELARLLPPDQPIYGIQAVGLDGRSARHITIEEMATHYIKEIVSFQPDGPIYLAGFSMGGVIAYEIAQQLHRLGRRVALLALLDSGPTGKTPWFFYGLAMTVYIPERCWFHFRQWLSLPFRERFTYIRGRCAALRYWMVRNRSRPPLITAPPQQTSERLEASLGTDYYHAVAHSYQLRPYPGAVDIFVSDESNPAWRFYWRHLVRGGVSFHRVSGGHLQILLSQDYMPAMAKSLTTVLRGAQEKERAASSGN
jgi:thioesterase domain-containing protein/acyl carrier protein